MSREELVAKIETSWDSWTAALDGIPAELTGEPGVCGYFSLEDLIGHIAFWDEQDLDRAHKLARGQNVQPNDWATMNDRDYEAHRDDTLEAQTARMLDAHAHLASDVRCLDNIDDLKLAETWEHYDDHRKDVLRWRESKGV